ncbi:MAG: hypothetical protein ABS79_05800 [Planctomycetes bacterium SCN 63-9]|nr:MAG: hypothetical protein ABS79_05800 [Planctomycetes bacterium SCN 63-9]
MDAIAARAMRVSRRCREKKLIGAFHVFGFHDIERPNYSGFLISDKLSPRRVESLFSHFDSLVLLE